MLLYCMVQPQWHERNKMSCFVLGHFIEVWGERSHPTQMGLWHEGKKGDIWENQGGSTQFMFYKPVGVQAPSHVQLFASPWTAGCQASLSLTVSQSLPRFLSIALVMLSSHLILWCPLLLLPSIFPSIRDFSNESTVCIRWPKYWNFSSSISLPMNIQNWFPLRLTGLISLLSKGLSGVSPAPQFEDIILRCSTFFMVQLSQMYVTAVKTIALTIRTFVGKASAFQHTV